MTLKDLAKKFVSEIKAGQIGEALDTASDILKSSAGFYKLVFGGASVAEVSEAEDAELEELEAELCDMIDEMEVEHDNAAIDDDGEITVANVPAGVDPALVLMVLEVVLKLIAERRNRKQ